MAGATAEIHSALLTARLMGDLGNQEPRDTKVSFLALARLSAPGQELPLTKGSYLQFHTTAPSQAKVPRRMLGASLRWAGPTAATYTILWHICFLR